jgi:prepilin-type N-terminal cleavage/methylation domain-containing protein/prepilin-type processing-associated H-X9-DG protein
MFLEHRRSRVSGFTLIELLVVIAIISLLISILLPTLSGARRTGQRVACMATLRQLSSGAAEYATDNDDWIVGSPSGSGAYIVVNGGQAYGPSVQAWDFMGPLARMWNMGLTFPSKGDDAGVARRFNELRQHKAFLCPSNGFLASWFSGPNAGTNRMVSYNTVRTQLLSAPDAEGGLPAMPGVTTAAASHNEKLPPKWRPNTSRMGNPANKVFVADGSRYATTTVAPDYDLGALANWGGAFSDPGAYSTFSRSWDRNWTNGSRLGVDARIYAYRHATADPPQGAPGNAFKMNVAFYDGHVDTQGDLESANPFQWLPQGSSVDPTSGGIWADAIAHFRIGGMIERVGP